MDINFRRRFFFGLFSHDNYSSVEDNQDHHYKDNKPNSSQINIVKDLRIISILVDSGRRPHATPQRASVDDL